MAHRVVDHIVEYLAAVGVEHLFGVDGANIEDLYDAAHFCDGITAVLRRGSVALAANRSSLASRLGERAHQDREIVYFLQDPTTHSFSLYHDYTETREGVDKYLNIVRAGSTVSNGA